MACVSVMAPPALNRRQLCCNAGAGTAWSWKGPKQQQPQKQQHRQRRRLRQWQVPPHRAAGTRALPPGLEELPAIASSSSSSGGFAAGIGGVVASAPTFLVAGMNEAIAQNGPLYLMELLLASIGAYAAAVWPNRPRGWAAKELVKAGPSTVAGKGVFALVHIQEGTVLGQYPGIPRTPAEMAAKCLTAPGARDYCFRTPDDRLLDPTDASGQLSAHPGPGLPWLPVDYTLAYVNEPPKGAGGTSVTVEDDPSDSAGLLCVAARAIQPGEELWMDYGLTYDRSSYARQQQPAEQDRQGVARGAGGSEQASSWMQPPQRQGEL